MPMTRRLPVIFSLLLMASPALAQVRPSEVGGTATDESGAVLPGVTITASQVGTGLTRTAVTDERGAYHFNALPVGVYKFRAELAGFAPLEVQEFTLGVGASAVLDLRLKLASAQ